MARIGALDRHAEARLSRQTNKEPYFVAPWLRNPSWH
jgi:hypothetical protein